MYSNGKGVDQSYAMAMEWRLLAAANGNAWAGGCIAEMYHESWGVPLNMELDLLWEIWSAERGNKTACYNMGQIHRLGLRGLDQDYEKAIQWYIFGFEQADDTHCMSRLVQLYASCPDPRYRDGKKAVAAMKQWVDGGWTGKGPVWWDKMAMAQARNGQFAAAIASQERAVAELKDDAAYTESRYREYGLRLQLYKQGQPYAQSYDDP
jgi:TPR repeat protein